MCQPDPPLSRQRQEYCAGWKALMSGLRAASSTGVEHRTTS